MLKWLNRAVLAGFLSAVVTHSLAADRPIPVTRVEVVTDRMHGVDIPDPYRWLENQESPETRVWIAAQNDYTRAVLDAFPGRDRLRAQIEKLSRVDFQGPPTVRSGRYFFTRKSATQNQSAIVMRQGPNGADRVLVDAMALSPDGSVRVRIMDITADGRMLAFLKRKGGEDETEVLFQNVDTGQFLPDRLARGVYYSVFVLPDKSGFLYSRRGTNGTRVLEHNFGRPVTEDRELFAAGMSDDKLIWLQFSEDGRFVAAFVNAGAGTAQSRIFVLDRFSKGTFRPLITDIPASFEGAFGGHTLFLLTTWNAPNGRVLAIDVTDPTPKNWREVIPATDSVITSVLPSGRKLLVSIRDNVSTRLSIFEPGGKLIRDISLPTLGSAYFYRETWDSDEVFYAFSSFGQPWATFRYDLASAKQSPWQKSTLPVDSVAIATTQIWYTSKDGTRVPMFIAAKKGFTPTGTHPVLLTGYGGYGSIQSPEFDSSAALWVSNGGIYALASIRGGGEFGEKWHRDGKLENKQNSFDDFIAAAEWLIANKYAAPGRLAIKGSSNGGMLVAAAAMQRPDLFQAVVCRNPHLDMLRYHKFLKAAPWVTEYGNPDVAADFNYLRKYSPYHQVRLETRYPAMLFMTGDNDTRVAPLHARKMAARVQAATTSGLPVLLRYDLVGGHSGSGSISSFIDQETDWMAFLYSQLHVTP